MLAEREQLRDEAVEAAASLADNLLALDDTAGAIHACRRGLALDRDDAALRRLRLKAYEAAGGPSATGRASE